MTSAVGESRPVDPLEGLPLLISVPKAAELLGISRAAAYRHASAGDLPCKRLGRRLYVITDRLREFIRPKRRKPIRRARFYHLFLSPPPTMFHAWYRDYYNYPRYILKHPGTAVEHIIISLRRRNRKFTHAPEYLKFLEEFDHPSGSAEITSSAEETGPAGASQEGKDL